MHEAIVFHIFHEQACKDYIVSPVVIFFILFVASAAFLFIAAREYLLAQRLFSHWLNTQANVHWCALFEVTEDWNLKLHCFIDLLQERL